MSLLQRLLFVLACALLPAGPVLAHGLLVSARAEGSAVVGRVYYSDGAPGAGEFVELRDLTQPGSSPVQSATTDGEGVFRFTAVQGRRYLVVAYGEEGHTTEVQLTLAAGERGRLVDAAPLSAGGRAPPPWMVLGGLLLLSLLPALWLRRRRPSAGASNRSSEL